MTTRADYRTDLNAKLVAIEDSGYGDFEFANDELNIYLELAVSALYPALYKKVALTSQTPSNYGTASFSRLSTTHADRIYLIVDTNEQAPLYGWKPVGDSIVGLDLVGLTGTVDAYYTDAYAMPDDDLTDVDWPAIWRPLIVLGALIEALESRQDSGVRGDPGPLGNNVEVPLLDRLRSRYETNVEKLAMSLPVAIL